MRVYLQEREKPEGMLLREVKDHTTKKICHCSLLYDLSLRKRGSSECIAQENGTNRYIIEINIQIALQCIVQFHPNQSDERTCCG